MNISCCTSSHLMGMNNYLLPTLIQDTSNYITIMSFNILCELCICSQYTHHPHTIASLQPTHTACLLYSVTLDATKVFKKSPPQHQYQITPELNYWNSVLFLQELLAMTHPHTRHFLPIKTKRKC